MRPRWTLSQILVGTGVLGTAAGLSVRYPRAVLPFVSTLVLPIAALVGLGSAIRFVSRLKPKVRLAIESATLVALLGLSAVTWNPFTAEEAKCLSLVGRAASATATCQETRDALNREAAWFRRRATDLRWRGLWLGLTLGPRIRDAAVWGRNGLTYELGTAESMEKHERRLKELITVGVCPEK